MAGVSACLLARGRFAGDASSVSSRRAWRGAGRIRHRFRLDDLPRARLVLPSRGRGSYPWRFASMRCPSCLILFACYYCSSRPSSRFSSRRASRRVCLAPDVFFLCFFRLVPRGNCACLICPPRPSCSVVSSFRLVLRLGRRLRRHVLLA